MILHIVVVLIILQGLSSFNKVSGQVLTSSDVEHAVYSVTVIVLIPQVLENRSKDFLDFRHEVRGP